MTPAQALAYLLAHNWTLAQIAGGCRVATSSVRRWSQWNADIPPWPALRLCVIASLHRALLQHLGSDPDDGLPAPSCIGSFAELALRHCRAR